METKKAELQKTTTESNQHIAEFQETNTEKDNLNLDLEVKQEEVILLNDERMPPPNMMINYHSDSKVIGTPWK